MKGLTNLKSLVVGLGDNEITDDGLIHLKGLTKLERLGIQKSAVTDRGLKHLEGLKSLKNLWISGTQVTRAGVRELRTALPDLKFDYVPLQ